MRLWSVHPGYFDRQALTACWREALLAQAVMAGRTRGYTRHPQLVRFRDQADPAASIGAFLEGIAGEADARGYRFDRSRIDHAGVSVPPIAVTGGQLAFEWAHLLTKLARRSPDVAAKWRGVDRPSPHPLFRAVDGPVAEWERASRPPGHRTKRSGGNR